MVSNKFGSTLHVPPELQEWVTHRQVSAQLRLSGPIIAGHLLNLFMLLIVCAGSAPWAMLGFMAFWVIGHCVERYWLANGVGRAKLRQQPARMKIILEASAVSLALAFAVTLAWLMIIAPPSKLVFLATIGSTLVAAAAFTMRMLARAAMAYIAIISAGIIVGLASTGQWESVATCVLIISASGLLFRMVKIAEVSFIQRILREREAKVASETVQMLLSDFQDQGSDWLFELDRDGNMLAVSDRFAEAAGQSAEDLNGRRFDGLFERSKDRSLLVSHLAARNAFRNVAVALAGPKQADQGWWSISGRPAQGGATAQVHFRGVISDISHAKQAEARVRHMAHYDSLTELPNRMMFTSAINRMIADRRKSNRIALLMIDLDHFKSVNDMYGHPTGDAYLRATAARLLACIESSKLAGQGSIVARLGGDEFALMFVGEDAVDHATRLAQQLIDSLAQPFDVNGHVIDGGASIGIALTPDHASDATNLLSYADMALYAAKEDGRGRWEMFTPGMDAIVHQRHGIARDLRTAVANGELRLFLQPLIDVESAETRGYEALMRWEHPERGLVMPNDFIPVAEETGLIVPMGEWMIRTALTEAAKWSKPHSIAINLSPIQLRSPNLLPTIMQSLGETGIDPARIELEITESVLMNDCEANIEILNRLHALGLKIALDDFGTGYASLNYLLTFPFDKIKIDRSFVTDLDNREEAQAIVGAVIGLANQLGMCTLAEGVEHEAQLQRLRLQGCEMVQGWLFGKAMPADHYAEPELPQIETQPPLAKVARRKAA